MPESPSDSVEVGIGDNRHADRLHVVDLLCSVGKRCSGTVIDMSETGVQIRYAGCKRYQSSEIVGLALRRHDVLLLVRAKVIWEKSTSPNDRIAGFQFEKISHDDKQTIRELMWRPDETVNVSKSA